MPIGHFFISDLYVLPRRVRRRLRRNLRCFFASLERPPVVHRLKPIRGRLPPAGRTREAWEFEGLEVWTGLSPSPRRGAPFSVLRSLFSGVASATPLRVRGEGFEGGAGRAHETTKKPRESGAFCNLAEALGHAAAEGQSGHTQRQQRQRRRLRNGRVGLFRIDHRLQFIETQHAFISRSRSRQTFNGCNGNP